MKASRVPSAMVTVLLLTAIIVAVPLGAAAKTADDQVLTRGTFKNLAKKARPAVVSVKINVETREKIEDWHRERRARPQAPERALPPEMEDMDVPDWLKEFFKSPRVPGPSGRDLERELFRYPYGAGTGAIVRSDGYIVTNRHVLFHPMAMNRRMFKEGQIRVVLADKREFTGDQVKLIAADSLTDLAVLKIEAKGLPTLDWADSDELEIGDWVMAIGDPLELTGSVSQGIISGIGRDVEIAGYPQLLQTTAVINPGNSGGPLINLDGKIVGVNMAIASNTRFWQGIGFAIPSSLAERVAEDLIEHGHPVRGYIGIKMTSPGQFPPLAAHEGFEGDGVGIEDVYEGLPAAEGGLKPYDIIVEIDGKKVENNVDVQRIITKKRPGDKIEFKVFRGGEHKTLTVTAGEWPDEEELLALTRSSMEIEGETTDPDEGPKAKGRIGLTVENYPDKPDASDEEKGVVVRRIQPDSPASAATPALQAGDVITEVEKKRVRNVDEFATIIKERLAEHDKAGKEESDTLLLKVSRGKSSQWVFVPLPKE